MIGRRLALLSIFLSFLSFRVEALELTFATENADSFPWIMTAGGGVDTMLIKTAAANLNHKINIIKVPWKRCLRIMENNQVDGCYAASFRPKRMKHGIYPMENGAPDASKQLHPGSYSLYVHQDSDVDWDGDQFINLNGMIGAPRGFSIISKLKEKGAAVDEGHSTESILKMLANGRLDAVAALTPQGDRLLKQNKDISPFIRKIQIPLVVKPYFLMFSHQRMKETPAMISEFYDEIEKVRQSDIYQNYYDTILAR